jgi:hypothetical protein
MKVLKAVPVDVREKNNNSTTPGHYFPLSGGGSYDGCDDWGTGLVTSGLPTKFGFENNENETPLPSGGR